MTSRDRDHKALVDALVALYRDPDASGGFPTLAAVDALSDAGREHVLADFMEALGGDDAPWEDLTAFLNAIDYPWPASVLALHSEEMSRHDKS